MSAGEIRIIGGEWRGRKLKVPNVPDLRPTPNRVRETLFNWLAPTIAGANCLDAFAGSGALGFEALSRGASHVVMVDSSAAVTKLLTEQAKIFKTEKAEIYCAKLPQQLRTSAKKFDIVFLDPPFQQDLLIPCCQYLEQHELLADNAYIYIEAKDSMAEADLPANWQIIKSKKAGQVAYHLVQRK